MASRHSRSRRFRKRINRRFYRGLVALYRAAFPTPAAAPRVDAEAVLRVLVVQHYGVGDMILTTPMLSYLKDRLPRAEIDVLASPRNASVVAGDAALGDVYVHDHSWRGWLRVLPTLRRRAYDVIFSGQTGKGLREGLTASLIARRHTRKVSIWRAKRYHGFFGSVVRVPRSVTHTADRLLYVAHHTLGGSGTPPTAAEYAPTMATDESAEERAAAYLAERGASRYVLVNVAAHFAARDWEPASCAAFLALLLKRHTDLAVVLTRPPGKGAQADEVARLCGSPRVGVAPALPVLVVGALVRRASAVVTVDTAIVHMASACRRPVVALYAPVAPHDVTLWLPVAVPSRVLASPYGGKVADIRPDAVADALDSLLRDVSESREVVLARQRSVGA